MARPGRGEVAVASFLAAASRLAAEREERAVPSPSSVAKCFRQLWYKGKGIPPTTQPDPESYIAAETGRMTEALLAKILEAADAPRLIKRLVYDPGDEEARELAPWELERMSMAGGQVDNIAETLDDDLILVEFKRKPARHIRELRDKGLFEAEPTEYYQVQSLMHAKQFDRCLYIAVFLSRQEVTSFMRGTERFAVYIEEVPYKRQAALLMKARAEKVREWLAHEQDAARVPRETVSERPDPRERAFPCGSVNRARVFTPWCPYYQRCLEDTEREANI